MISDFISRVKRIHATGSATEHSYRSAFENLFNDFGVTALNEPKRVKCGAPDFIIYKDKIVIGHLEAKDLNIPIRSLSDYNKEQHERYKAALPNLIYTNGLDWDFYRNGELTASVSIADYLMGIQPKQEKYHRLELLLNNFIVQKTQTITNPRELAKHMAGKAQLIKDVLYKTLRDDKNHQTELAKQYKAFKENLIKDINLEDFADIYAETIVYGMFGARLHQPSQDSFNRQVALKLLPKSNPFLRALFNYLAGYNLDDRIAWIIDDLANIFQFCDLPKLMEGFSIQSDHKDPFLHFYETFLSAYNPTKKRACGVWYTPEPIVNFIVRSVDEVLKKEFKLLDGLADTSKVYIEGDSGPSPWGGEQGIQEEVHRVQILDPATGTGTFLAAVVKHIAPRIQGIAPGLWSQYIENNLIPRLHGFELLMASYAMCHLKIDMILTEMGYKPSGDPPRLSVYLTNSLEKGEPKIQPLPFNKWLSDEAKGANTIKRIMPIMCILGNPPYSGSSSNNGKWITNLIAPYKMEPGGEIQLKEKNPKWINDDYVKFIRFAEYLISRTGEGVLGFITNHGYLDNPTFRGMRWHLLNTFNRIHVLDLHGNANKKEITPEGKPDKNVFDIQQGVAIIIAVKIPNGKKGLAEVYHSELWGTREDKYAVLTKGSIGNLITNRIKYLAPQYHFVCRDNKLLKIYEHGFKLTDFMPISSTGIVTARDNLVIDFTLQELTNKIRNFIDLSDTDDQIRTKFFPHKRIGKYPPGDNLNWKLPTARRALTESNWNSNILPITYRPFDTRFILYQKDMIERMRPEIMFHMRRKENFALACCRQNKGGIGFHHVFCHYNITESSLVSNKTSEISSCFPLYLYKQKLVDPYQRINFDTFLYKELQNLANHKVNGIPDEVAVFDYIYGVLHCPAYRKTYSEFLKIDFPYIPWPANPDEFWDISAKGCKLRKLHLMDSTSIGQVSCYPFKGSGDNVVATPQFKDERIWINSSQYFDNVPVNSWNFYIGGYQPAQKWLKDRKGRVLNFDDVKHYWEILKILTETDRIMRTIRISLEEHV